MPRPTKRTPAVVEDILSRLREGEPLAVICRSDEKFPHPNVWRDWCELDETLALAYAHAREVGEDKIAAEALEITDSDPETYSTEHGSRVDPGDVAHKKLRIETRLKLLAIWNPKKYGNKVDVTTGGERVTTDPGDVAVKAAAILEEARRRRDKDDGN